MIFSISVMPPTLGSDARAKSMSRCSTSGLKSARVPHSSPGASGTEVSIRSFGIWLRNCSSRSGSSTQYGRSGSISRHTSTASWKSNFWCRSIIQLPASADAVANLLHRLDDAGHPQPRVERLRLPPPARPARPGPPTTSGGRASPLATMSPSTR
jgi:hypothetical protein